MPTIDIPIKCYAVAAYEAAKETGEDPADVFDDNRKPRARWIAICAMRSVFPRACATHIAKNMGFIGDSRALARALTGAQESRWWRDHDVSPVISAICLSLRLRAGGYFGVDRPETGFDAVPAREAEEPKEPARKPATFKVRPVRPIPIRLAPIARGNLTASICGDPPPGRREMLASMKDEPSHRGQSVYSWGYDR